MFLEKNIWSDEIDKIGENVVNVYLLKPVLIKNEVFRRLMLEINVHICWELFFVKVLF